MGLRVFFMPKMPLTALKRLKIYGDNDTIQSMKERQTIKGVTSAKERAFYGAQNTDFINCRTEGEEDGESAFKETENITLDGCSLSLRYPLWHCKNSTITNSVMADTCRAALWYDENLLIKNLDAKGIKALRESKKITIGKSSFLSDEFCWRCEDLNLHKVKVESVYAFFQSENAFIQYLDFKGKYSFQYVRNFFIRNSSLDTKDAFWHSEDVTCVNCDIKGEYLGWYSKNLTLIDCRISGTQPLCYAENLKLVNCTMEGCDLSFERSTVEAEVNGKIDSVKNAEGKIEADEIGDIIRDEYAKGDCEIIIRDKK